MGTHRCCICKCDPGPFFVWTTSRRFPRKTMIEVLKIESVEYKKEIGMNGKEVCLNCLDKLKNQIHE